MLPVLILIVLIVYQTARMGAPWGPRPTKLLRFPPVLSRVKRCQSFLELFLSLSMLLCSSLFFLLFSMSFFIFFRSLLGSILSSQADLPTLKNLDFASAGARFLKNQHFRSKDGFESVLGLSRAPFGSSWGVLGRLLGALWGL